ncbi:amidohydrolase [Pseudomonas typographi]|uniref:amidohydrolase n=1 Tax=Pseudomonas typographi TaxID=2715964 RepID=UPI0016835501|nr:amidohydrolase [Pseudomonas typographi]MBD1588588.1 amidohydrolase [Pseudomonas typographi]
MRDMSSLPDLAVALVQTTLAWHDRTANLSQFDSLLEHAQGADLIILPEMFTTGFTMNSAALCEAPHGPTSQWLLRKAAECNAVITGSVIIQAEDGTYRNRLLWATPTGDLLHYDKRHLFRMAGEHEHYTAGEQRMVFEVKGWRVRPLVCYDLRFPVWSRDGEGTDLLLYTANWPGARRLHWNRLLPARAVENLCYVAAVNRVGTDGKGFAYAGDSQVLDFQGETLLCAGDADGVFQVCLGAAQLSAYRARFPAHLDADSFELAAR